MFVEHKELVETFGNNVEVSEEIDVTFHDSHNVDAQVEPNPNFNVLQYKIWLEYVATGVTQLTDSQVVKVSKFSSTVYGCMSYYFDHVSTFENDTSNTEEFHARVAHTSMKPESLPHASVSNESESFVTDQFEPVKRECKICSDEFLIEDMYLLNCSASHAWCLPCLVHHIRLCVLGDVETQPHIPACPLANGPAGCNYLLEEREMAQVVQLANEFYQDSGDPLVGDREAAVLKKAISNLCMAKAHRDHNHMRCVNCSGDDEDSACWFALPNDTAQQPMCVQCPRCQTDFCSQCRRSPCHYRSDCADVVAYSRAWNEWLQGGRDVFIVELQRQTSKLQQFEANRKEIADAEARFAELQQMEKYKEDHCRRCPNCQRTVEKLSGCDAMVCGQNAHGGDVQNGCG